MSAPNLVGVVQFDSLTPEKRRQGQYMTDDERALAQQKFLARFRKVGTILSAARSAKITRQIVYYWLEHDEQFNLDYHDAIKDVNDAIVDEIDRRGRRGYKEGKITKYSDTLLIFLAKARMPEFREKQQFEMSGPGGSPMQVQRVYDFSRLSDDEFEQYKSLSAKARGG